MSSQTSFGKRFFDAFRRKWVQVVVATVVLMATVSASARYLAAKPQTKADVAKSGGFKYLHCEECRFEIPYVAGKENTPAVGCKCKKPVVGYWKATMEPLPKSGEAPPAPNRKYYSALLVEGLLYLFALYYILSRPVSERNFFYLKCFNCSEMLRYTRSGFGVFVKCPRCGQLLKLPDEDEAMTMDDYNESIAESTVEEYELRLRAAGHRFPGDEPPPDELHPAGDPPKL